MLHNSPALIFLVKELVNKECDAKNNVCVCVWRGAHTDDIMELSINARIAPQLYMDKSI